MQLDWQSRYNGVYQCATVLLTAGIDVPSLEKNLGNKGCTSCGGTMLGNPINVSTGNKYDDETDVVVDGAWPMVFERFYNSYDVGDGGTGQHWRHTYSRHVIQQSGTEVKVIQDDGSVIFFQQCGTLWCATLDETGTLVQQVNASGFVDGWNFRSASNISEQYDGDGALLSETDVHGLVHALTYDQQHRLSTITSSEGRVLTLGYDTKSRVSSVVSPDGTVIQYTYDASNNLASAIYPGGGVRAYTYDEAVYSKAASGSGLLTGIQDEVGNRFATYKYDSSGRAISSEHAGGTNGTYLTYNANGSTTFSNALGNMQGLSFVSIANTNHMSQISGSSCVGCSPWARYSYNAAGDLASTWDFKGTETTYTFDAAHLEEGRIEASGTTNQRTANTTWDITLRVPLTRTVLDNNGQVLSSSSSSYNLLGELLSSCAADPAVPDAISYACGSAVNAPVGVQQKSYTYCNVVDSTQCPLIGLLLAVDGPRTDVSDITHYSYYITTDESGCGTVGGACHRAGDLYQATNALGHITTMVAYDKNGRLARSQDSNNVITDLTYTPRGWLKTRTIGRATTTIDYDAVGNVIKITDADGVFVGYTYDAAHRLTDITDALGNHIHYTLDAAGNKTKEDTCDSGNTLRRTMSRSYNTLGQLTGITDGLNHTVFNASYTDSYDANGNLVHTADGLGIQRKQGYDALNRLVSTLDNYNGTDTATQNTQATLAYDALDNLEGVTDPDGLSTTYDYDGLSNPKALHSPDTGTTSFQVDAAGNRIQQTDAKGIVRTTTYDAINRPVTVSYPDSTQNIAYHYDEADSVTGCSGSFSSGRLTRIVETAVTTTYCYDNHGNVTKKSQAQGSQVDITSYSYTAADRLSTLTTPSQTVTQYSRDTAGRISGVTVTPNGGVGQTVVSAISYLPFGPISSYTLGNGQTITRSYDANYQLTDLTSPALNLHFARDVMGNITALGSSPGANPAVETYGYDPLYRLANVNDSSGNAIEAYTYSKTGDRLSKIKNGGLATGAYGYQSGTHWLTSIGNAARSYDANGNTIGSANAGETLGYGYNDRNRLAVVQRNQQTVATYVYTVMGERLAKMITSPQIVNERFAYNEVSQLIGEYGTTNRDYIWLGSLPVAVVDSGATSAVNYVHADGLGTPRAVSDAAGNTIWQWVYQSNPFGERQPTGSYVFNLRFPGQYFDIEAGLVSNGARFYDPSTNRFVESDPSGLTGGLSTYATNLNNPLKYIDTDGMHPTILGDEAAYDAFMHRSTWQRISDAASSWWRQTVSDMATLSGENPNATVTDALMASGRTALTFSPFCLEGGEVAIETQAFRDALAPGSRAQQMAENYASSLRSSLPRSRLPTATSAAVDRATGDVYYGTSGTSPGEVAPLLQGRIPDPSLEDWAPSNCAEFNACNNALLNGASIEDLDVYTVRTFSGKAFPACRNCQVTIQGANILSE